MPKKHDFLTIAQAATIANRTCRTFGMKVKKRGLTTVLRGNKKFIHVDELVRNFKYIVSQDIENEFNPAHKSKKRKREMKLLIIQVLS